MTTHAKKAQLFLSNEERTNWHDQTLWIVRQKRDAQATSVPEWEELREKASLIKDNVLSHLDTYLEQLEAAAVKNGVQVLRASDAAEFNNTILDIIHKHKAKNMVKSKSMLTEECGLNHFLHENGIDVVDTDLGERIIQFRGETPSHIVLPAIHLKKEEIGETFHEKLGTEKGASDPTYLTRAARKHLREKFLAADIALTGVNFAVAESGTLVVCTNEGNADMGVHAAPVQIHCMGIEKIIPHQEDLGIFTRLLARNATGQAVTTYTSHYRKPKPGGAMYLVIVDNGRSKYLADPKYKNSLKCIRCGGCMNTCPVYRRSGGHSYGYVIPGPIGSILAPQRNGKKYADLPFASSLCGSCTNVCPVKIDIHEQLYRWRQDLTEQKQTPFVKRFSMKVAGFVLSKNSLYNVAGGLARQAIRYLPHGLLYLPINAWGKGRELPAPPKQSFKEWYVQTHKDVSTTLDMTTVLNQRHVDKDCHYALDQKPCHCGLDPQSTDSPTAPIMGSRVERGMTEGNDKGLIERGMTSSYSFLTSLKNAGADIVELKASEIAGYMAATWPGVLDFDLPETQAEYPATCSLEKLNKVEHAAFTGKIGIAENGAIWLEDKNLPHRILPFITQHLILKIEKNKIISTMQDAYGQIRLEDLGFGVFISGPSKTADIEQSLVYGAHGAKELTVILYEA